MALTFSSMIDQAQDAPVPLIPETLPLAVRTKLMLVRAPLLDRVEAYNRRVDAFNSACGQIQPTNTTLVAACTEKYKTMVEESAVLDEDKKRFVAQLDSAVAAANTATASAEGRNSTPADRVGASGSDTKAGDQLLSAADAARAHERADLAPNYDKGGASNVGSLSIPSPNGQTPGAAELARHIPGPAQTDHLIQQSMAYYKKVDGEKIDTQTKLAAVQKQIDSHAGDDTALKAQKDTLSNDLDRYKKDQEKTEAQIKERLVKINMKWDESPTPPTGKKQTQ
jgi:hypothetical protein